MSIATYTELVTAVGEWLHRTDASLTTQIPDFIQLAEDEINTDMRLRLMEVDMPVTLVSGTRTITLPVRYLEPMKLMLQYPVGADEFELVYISPEQMVINGAAGLSSQPLYWTINGNTIEFPNLADQNYSLTFRMLQGFDIAATATNSLLSSYRGIYLYGALLQGSAWAKNPENIPTWERMYEKLRAKANKKEARTKKLVTLVTDLPNSRYKTNILRGW